MPMILTSEGAEPNAKLGSQGQGLQETGAPVMRASSNTLASQTLLGSSPIRSASGSLEEQPPAWGGVAGLVPAKHQQQHQASHWKAGSSQESYPRGAPSRPLTFSLQLHQASNPVPKDLRAAQLWV
jgi:hypothetical protein